MNAMAPVDKIDSFGQWAIRLTRDARGIVWIIAVLAGAVGLALPAHLLPGGNREYLPYICNLGLIVFAIVSLTARHFSTDATKTLEKPAARRFFEMWRAVWIAWAIYYGLLLVQKGIVARFADLDYRWNVRFRLVDAGLWEIGMAAFSALLNSINNAQSSIILLCSLILFFPTRYDSKEVSTRAVLGICLVYFVLELALRLRFLGNSSAIDLIAWLPPSVYGGLCILSLVGRWDSKLIPASRLVVFSLYLYALLQPVFWMLSFVRAGGFTRAGAVELAEVEPGVQGRDIALALRCIEPLAEPLVSDAQLECAAIAKAGSANIAQIDKLIEWTKSAGATVGLSWLWSDSGLNARATPGLDKAYWQALRGVLRDLYFENVREIDKNTLLSELERYSKQLLGVVVDAQDHAATFWMADDQQGASSTPEAVKAQVHARNALQTMRKGRLFDIVKFVQVT